jgi:hypothetical protein
MSAPLQRDVVHVADEMIARLDELARAKSRALTREVSRSAVERAAVLAWLDGAERGPLGVGLALHASRPCFVQKHAPTAASRHRWSGAHACRTNVGSRER